MDTNLCLVDTSIWIEVLARRRSAPPTLVERIENLVAAGRAAVTGMIQLELLGGARNEGDYRALAEALDALPSLGVTEGIWREASRMAFDLRRRGVGVPAPDLIIAAVGLREGALLVHRDRHFDAIAQVFPLRVESYVSM